VRLLLSGQHEVRRATRCQCGHMSNGVLGGADIRGRLSPRYWALGGPCRRQWWAPGKVSGGDRCLVTTVAGQADVMLGSGLLFSSFTLGHSRLME